MASALLRVPELAGGEALLSLLRGRRVVVLAGAGCSTESGIPDYRGPQGSLRTRAPMQYRDFVGSEAARARYWARSAVGWLRFSAARPNDAHHALARLEEGGVVQGIITQNVDGLHHTAGSRRVVELHGSLSAVRCLACGVEEPRAGFQERLVARNPDRVEALEVETAPDGDAELPAIAVEGFHVPGCARCGGVVKPDVVFFGENVPAAWLRDAWSLFDRAEVLLVAGSSLVVYSGRRFVYRAQQDGLPIGVVNLGPTRADEVAVAKVDGRLGQVLPWLAGALLGGTG